MNLLTSFLTDLLCSRYDHPLIFSVLHRSSCIIQESHSSSPEGILRCSFCRKPAYSFMSCNFCFRNMRHIFTTYQRTHQLCKWQASIGCHPCFSRWKGRNVHSNQWQESTREATTYRQLLVSILASIGACFYQMKVVATLQMKQDWERNIVRECILLPNIDEQGKARTGADLKHYIISSDWLQLDCNGTFGFMCIE